MYISTSEVSKVYNHSATLKELQYDTMFLHFGESAHLCCFRVTNLGTNKQCSGKTFWILSALWRHQLRPILQHQWDRQGQQLRKRFIFICAVCNSPYLDNTACLISLLHIREHLESDKASQGKQKKLQVELASFRMKSWDFKQRSSEGAASRAVCLEVSEIQLNSQRNVEIDIAFILNVGHLYKFLVISLSSQASPVCMSRLQHAMFNHGGGHYKLTAGIIN